MNNTRCNGSSNSGRSSSCSRNGERIMVNRSGGNTDRRSRCSCVNTYRPGSGGNQGDCGCGRNMQDHNCQRPQRPCPKPCPPRRSCEDRCQEQYRRCVRNCRTRDDDLREDRGEAFGYEDEMDYDYETYEE